VSVESSANVITLALHADLYPRFAVDQAVAAFAGLGELSVEAEGDYLRVTIRPAAGAAAAVLGAELANYALSVAVVGPPEETGGAPAADADAAADPA
jgi:hypothetical protein